MKLVGYATCDARGQVVCVNTAPEAADLPDPGRPDWSVVIYDPQSWPGFPCYWDTNQSILVSGFVPGEDVEVAKQRVIDLIEAGYAGALLSGFVYGNWRFQSSPASLDAINAYVLAAQAATALGTEMAPVDFRLADNNTVSLSRADWLHIGVELAYWRNQLNVRRQALKAQARAAQTRAELLAITWV